MSNIQNESSGQTSAQIYITSKSNYKRVISTNNYSNIMYYFNSSINVSDGFVFLISLHDAIIPVTWYVISSYNGNNLFNYEINNVSYSYTIPDGNYSVTDLVNLFNSSSIETTNGIITSYDSLTNILTFTNATTDFTILSTSTCLDILGLTTGINTTSTNYSLTCPYQVDLSGTREIYVKTNLHTINLDSRIGTMTSSIIAKVPVVVDNMNFIYYSNITQNRIILKDRTINNIQIVLEDDEGNLLDLTMNYSLSLDVHIIPNKFLQYTNAITNGN